MEDNKIEGTKESVEELIMRMTEGVPGIGKKTASVIAVDFEDDLKSFLTADESRLEKIKRSNGKQILDSVQIHDLIEAKSAFSSEMSLQDTWVIYLGRIFLAAQRKMVRDLHFNNFDINPFLAKALGLDNPRKVIAFNVYQTVTRSVVTSWGFTVEEIAKFVGCRWNDYVFEKRKGNNFDLVKYLDGIDYYIQIKSGPNTMNVDMVTSLNEAMEKIKVAKPAAKGVLGMTYGTRDRISGQIMGNLAHVDECIKIGRELWDFISGEESFHKHLFSLLEASSKDILKDSFVELIEAKINELTDCWVVQNPGMKFDDFLENYI